MNTPSRAELILLEHVIMFSDFPIKREKQREILHTVIQFPRSLISNFKFRTSFR